MKNYSHLINPYNEFKSEIEDFISELDQISSGRIQSVEDLQAVYTWFKNWRVEVDDFLQEVFSEGLNGFYIEFSGLSPVDPFSSHQYGVPLTTKTQQLQIKLRENRDYLLANIKLIGVCDLIKSNSIVVDGRKVFSTQDKLDFLMAKLYELNDDFSYPLDTILIYNGVAIKNNSEVVELANRLKRNGYVEVYGGIGGGVNGKITVDGTLYYEEHLASNPKFATIDLEAIPLVEKVKGEIYLNKCFIIHGRDDARKWEVAWFVEKDLGKKTVILHEEANQGRTIIEKFEEHSIVDFAVAIWTGDDVGGLKDDVLQKPRARQNVVFETAYFIGKLGRKRVIVLYEEDVELPSDYSGVLFIKLSGNWKESLRKEIEAIYKS